MNTILMTILAIIASDEDRAGISNIWIVLFGVLTDINGIITYLLFFNN